MARTINILSKRQKVFAYLDTQTHRPRADVVADVMQDFDMKRPYAMTLYQTHRTQGKTNGLMVEVFSIRDHKEGVTVDPYVFSKHIPTTSVANTDATSVPVAVESYKDELKGRLNKAVDLSEKV